MAPVPRDHWRRIYAQHIERAQSMVVQWCYPVSNIIGAKELWLWFFPRKAPTMRLVIVSAYISLDFRSLTLLESLRVS